MGSDAMLEDMCYSFSKGSVDSYRTGRGGGYRARKIMSWLCKANPLTLLRGGTI